MSNHKKCLLLAFRPSKDQGSRTGQKKFTAVEPRFNELPRDWGNLFVISRVRYIGNLDITNLWKNNKNVRYIEIQSTLSLRPLLVSDHLS